MGVQTVILVGAASISLVVLLFAVVVLWKMFKGDIELSGLLAETSGTPGAAAAKASLSRFQLLVFTFVIAGLFLLLSIRAGTFVDVPINVLGLLGVSAGTYLVSKAVK
jgi:hypothetical protein